MSERVDLEKVIVETELAIKRLQKMVEFLRAAQERALLIESARKVDPAEAAKTGD